ncbi:MAG: acetyl-CoA carboxylase carboxyltransferase subunit alpha, partial [Verrucomicrobiota bacterium]|nr:acetyl-CoA carboxylase carboxyltransferase subunit alpha [Verrucomicrobiota bacterium]
RLQHDAGSAKSEKDKVEAAGKVVALERRLEQEMVELYAGLTPWQKVQVARHPERPYTLDYLRWAFTDFVELHGDRLFGDDKAMPCGLAKIGPHRCAVLTQQKGRDTKENVRRNFGCAYPEGYRKALRVMRLAEKFKLPVIAMIDTPGAYPGIGSEERHIAEAIAVNLREMMTLRVPIIAVVIGEGGSGGALGIGVADRVLILENAYYSVISPEACSAILWKDRRHAPEAAEALKLTADNLMRLGVVDEVVEEPEGGAHRDHDSAAAHLGGALRRNLERVKGLTTDELLERRYQKFRRLGNFEEGAIAAAAV